MSKLGTEKIEAVLADLKDLVIVGKHVKADGKIDANDLVHVIAIVPKIPKFIEDFKDLSALIAEGKDIDAAEAVGLFQKIDAMVKEVEKA